MKYALCNELFEGAPLREICRIAQALGYDGLEIAPFTLAPYAHQITAGQRAEARTIIAEYGLETVGLHWLLVGPDGLHMTSPDRGVWEKTRDYFRQLIVLCHDLSGRVLVIGSPKQRNLIDGQTHDGAWHRAVELFTSVLDEAEAAGVTLCLEPLSTAETDFINSVEEGMKMVRRIEHPCFKIHLDVKAMFAEGRPVAEIIRSVRADDVGHFHVNDPNLYGPGMGALDYAPILAAIDEIGWDRWLSVEVFRFDPGGEAIARRSIEYLKSFQESVE